MRKMKLQFTPKTNITKLPDIKLLIRKDSKAWPQNMN